MKLLILSLLAGIWPGAKPARPDSLTLNYCYNRIREHYPLARKLELQQKITDLNVEVAQTGYYPQLDLGGSATYQSEVTNVPGGMGPGLSKDQYKLNAEITQPVYNGGAVGIRKNMEREKGRHEEWSVKVQLHELRSQIDHVYFNILLSREQSKTINLLIHNLNAQLKTVFARVDNGALLPSQKYTLQAELIKARQDSSDSRSNISAGYEVLSELIGENIATTTVLKLPHMQYESLIASVPNRPELELFESNQKILDYQKALNESSRLPKVSAFGTAAYGRPGYNFFNNDFHEFYIVGLKVNWNFWDWKNGSDRQKALSVQQQNVEENRRAFDRQLNASLHQIEHKITSLKNQILQDHKVIDLREKVVKESASQLKNGVITATEYVTELTKSNQARLSLYAHRVQLAQMQIKYATTKGLHIFDDNHTTSN